jgi:hypothetical protein
MISGLKNYSKISWQLTINCIQSNCKQ